MVEHTQGKGTIRIGRALGTPGRPTVDAAKMVKEAPPNFGRMLLPQILTFSGRSTSWAKIYRNPDYALRHSRENAHNMRSDVVISECLEARQRVSALASWHLEPEDAKDPRQKQLVELLTKIIQRIPRFTEYRRNLLEALWYGRTAVQHRYGHVMIGGQRHTTVTDYTPIHGDKIVFHYDEGSGQFDNNSFGIRMGSQYNADDTLQGGRKLVPTDWGMAYFLEPWERTLVALHRHMIEDGPFEDPLSAGRIFGVGIRDRIYWEWYQKQETMATLMEVIHRTGTGFTIYYYDRNNPASKAAMEDAAANANHENTLVIPRNGDPTLDVEGVERIEPNTGGIEVLKGVIREFFGHNIKRYILGQTLTSEAEATGLGSGVADAHQNTFFQIASYDASNLEETLTQDLVRPLQAFNSPWARNIYVRFKIDTESSQSDKRMSALRQAWEMGARLKESEVMEIVGASMPNDNERFLQNPSMMQQTRLWEQRHGGQPEGDPDGQGGEPSMDDMFGPLMQQLQGGEAPPEGGAEAPPQPQQYARMTYASGVPTMSGNAGKNSKTGRRTSWWKNIKPKQPEHYVGETKQINGKNYRLNENHRWELDDPSMPHRKEELYQGGAAQQATPTADPMDDLPGAPEGTEASDQDSQSTVDMAADPTETHDGADDHEARKAFVRQELAKVDASVRGVIAAFHNTKSFEQGAESHTKSFAPQQASQLYSWLQQNAGEPMRGKRVQGGWAVDLGQGRLGYASTAGSIVVWPPDENGKQQISYTARTKIVSAAGKLDMDVAPRKAQEPPIMKGENAPANRNLWPPEGESRQAAPPAVPEPAAEQAPEQPAAETGPVPAQGGGAQQQETPVMAEVVQPEPQSVPEQQQPPKQPPEQPAATPRQAKSPRQRAAESEAMRRLGITPSAQGQPTSAELRQREVDRLEGRASRAPSSPKPPKPAPAPKPAWHEDTDSHRSEVEAHGLSATPQTMELLSKEIASGRIATKQQLRRVLAQAKKLHERGNVAEGQEASVQESVRRRINRAERPKRATFDSQVESRLDDFKIDRDTLSGIANELYPEYMSVRQEREQAKEAARTITGLDAGALKQLENQGYDYGSKHPRIRNLDSIGRQLASQFPGLGWGRGADDDDGGQAPYDEFLWELIKEGNTPVPSKHSDEFWSHVDEYLNSQAKPQREPGDDYDEEEERAAAERAAEQKVYWDSVPFRKEGTRMQYRRWLQDRLNYGA